MLAEDPEVRALGRMSKTAVLQLAVFTWAEVLEPNATRRRPNPKPSGDNGPHARAPPLGRGAPTCSPPLPSRLRPTPTGASGALFRYANDHDVEKAAATMRASAAINIWSHHGHTQRHHEESAAIGTSTCTGNRAALRDRNR